MKLAFSPHAPCCWVSYPCFDMSIQPLGVGILWWMWQWRTYAMVAAWRWSCGCGRGGQRWENGGGYMYCNADNMLSLPVLSLSLSYHSKPFLFTFYVYAGGEIVKVRIRQHWRLHQSKTRRLQPQLCQWQEWLQGMILQQGSWQYWVGVNEGRYDGECSDEVGRDKSYLIPVADTSATRTLVHMSGYFGRW